MENKIIHSLVLDQSTTTVGWAVINNDPEHVVGYGVNGKLFAHGIITTIAKDAPFIRVSCIEEDILSILKKYPLIEEIVIESITNFTQRSGKTQQTMGWGRMMLEKISIQNNLKIYEQDVQKIKEICTFNSKASKEEMIQAALEKWNLKSVKDHNHADALCGAYAWLFQGDEKRLPKVKKLKKKKVG
jgi:Holliday junction resolvasome RuvABC endonuclease subunit